MMKHTLFNMAVGCLAALSLAACGGGGGSSSGSDGSSLLSPGYNVVRLLGRMDEKNFYTINLNRGGECLLSFWDASGQVSEDYVGRWTERQLADGSFEIQVTGLPTTDVGCVIRCNNPMILRIPADEMARYRNGEVVTGSFDSSPLTHTAKAGCHITTEEQLSASPTASIWQDDGLE